MLILGVWRETGRRARSVPRLRNSCEGNITLPVRGCHVFFSLFPNIDYGAKIQTYRAQGSIMEPWARYKSSHWIALRPSTLLNAWAGGLWHTCCRSFLRFPAACDSRDRGGHRRLSAVCHGENRQNKRAGIGPRGLSSALHLPHHAEQRASGLMSSGHPGLPDNGLVIYPRCPI